jgi:hypothetical protein
MGNMPKRTGARPSANESQRMLGQLRVQAAERRFADTAGERRIALDLAMKVHAGSPVAAEQIVSTAVVFEAYLAGPEPKLESGTEESVEAAAATS